MSKYKIDLQDYRTVGSKVFTGRDRGSEVRQNSKIDTLITQYEEVDIVIPEDIRSINPSFLEEFLMNAVTQLGETVFNKKIKFINEGRYKVQEDLNEAIERILRVENALA